MTERPTPETDALVPSQGRRRTMREYIEELEAHALSLERQRDELVEALENLENDDDSIPYHAWDRVKSAIAAVKGGKP